MSDEEIFESVFGRPITPLYQEDKALQLIKKAREEERENWVKLTNRMWVHIQNLQFWKFQTEGYENASKSLSKIFDEIEKLKSGERGKSDAQSSSKGSLTNEDTAPAKRQDEKRCCHCWKMKTSIEYVYVRSSRKDGWEAQKKIVCKECRSQLLGLWKYARKKKGDNKK